MAVVALAHFTPSAFKGELIVIGLIVAGVALWVRDVRRHPRVPRRGCNGTGISRSRWNRKAVGPCRKRSHRDGRHMRRRFGAPHQ